MTDYKLKIKALLHDPPQKPLALMETREGHEAIGRDLIEILLGKDEINIPVSVRTADHVASAADRYSFPYDEAQPYRFSARFCANPVVVHPISGEQVKLNAIDPTLNEVIKANVILAVKEIADKYKTDEQKYLALWKRLPELIKKQEEGNEKVGFLWDVLPADTRIPDHSIWSHQRIVSALAGAGIHHDNAAMVLFTVGPVQDFIAAARRTKDLWSGSYMLSWLTWKAMEVYCDALGPDCILFPDLFEQPLVDHWLKNKGIDVAVDNHKLLIPTLPNRFFVIVPDAEADQLAQKAEEAVKQELRNIGDFAWGRLEFPEELPQPGKEQWDNQLETFMEVNWAALKMPAITQEKKNGNYEPAYKQAFAEKFNGLLDWQDESHPKTKDRSQILDAFDAAQFKTNIGTVYGRLYEILEKATGSRKSLRDFKQVEESGYRCTLIPKLAAVIPDYDNALGQNLLVKEFDEAGHRPSPRLFRAFWRGGSLDNGEYIKGLVDRHKTAIHSNERLSAVALAKRFFDEYLEDHLKGSIEGDFGQKFPSTHSFAAADFKLDLFKFFMSDAKEESKIKLKSAITNFYEAICSYELELKKYVEDPQIFEMSLPRLKYASFKLSRDFSLKCPAFHKLSGIYFFEDSFTASFENEELNLSESATDQLNHSRDKAFDALRELYKLTDELNIQRPAKYYGIIHFDGDYMGRWLSGEKAPPFMSMLHPDIAAEIRKGGDNKQFKAWEMLIKNKGLKRPLSPSLHASISTALNNFSLHLVYKIVEKDFLGKLIYAGGDDVVAMVSFRDALPCMEKLRAAYSGFIIEEKDDNEWQWKVAWDRIPETNENDQFQKSTRSGFVHVTKGWEKISEGSGKRRPVKDVLMTMGKKATASAGVALVHYYHPLRQGLQDARNAEKFAKEQLRRNAFAITIAKRSGETVTSGAKWIIEDKDQKRIERIHEKLHPFSEAIRNGKISKKFIVDLKTIAHVFESEHLPKEALALESKRLFDRHSEGFKDKGIENWKDIRNTFWSSTIEPLLVNAEKWCIAKESNPDSTERKNRDGHIIAMINLLETAQYIGKGGGR